MAKKRFKFGSGEFRKESIKRTMMVLRSATQKLVNGQRDKVGGVKHGGHSVGAVPVDTGNLMRSLMGSTSSMPAADQDGEITNNVGQIAGVILNWEAGEKLWLGYTAVYAPRMNYGFVGDDKLGRTYNQSGYFFVEEGVGKWPQYLKEAEDELPEF